MKYKLTTLAASVFTVVSAAALTTIMFARLSLSPEISQICGLGAFVCLMAGLACLVVVYALINEKPRPAPFTPYAMQVFFGATDMHIEQMKRASRKEPTS